MTTTTISPFLVGELREMEFTNDKGEKKKVWRKQILPSGTRKYKGQELDFSRINPSVVKAFEEGARDQVPFVFANADNSHPSKGEEIKQLEGDLEKLELSTDGALYGFFSLSDEAQKRVKNSNNKFGVSGAIDVDYVREDIGKKYDYVLSHVCGTTGPHIKGLGKWEQVELSEEEKKQITIDLSTEVIEEKATPTQEEETVAIEIPKAQFDKLMAFIGDVEKAEEELNNSSSEGNTEEVKLSEADTRRIELAEQKAQEGFRLAERAQIELAETRWNARKAELVRDGVPPVLLSEAEKVMRLHRQPVIKLSDTETVNASEVIDAMLEAAKGLIPLGPKETHQFSDVVGQTAADKEFEEFEKSFFSDFDIK